MGLGLARETTRTFEELRSREFKRLDEAGHAYLDYTGSGLYPESLITEHADFLRTTLLGNPHSEGSASAHSTRIIEDARRRVLEFFDADDEKYAVCFTANASAALKLVGEAYRFEKGSRLALVADNHNSVNGIREYARARGAVIDYLPLTDELRAMGEPGEILPEVEVSSGNLLAYPAQSNFSGVQHPTSLIDEAHDKGYEVLLDAAAFVPTNRLSLHEASPEFVCISFYKMFGYPTGVGALIGQREALSRLNRPWFAGGTVEYVSVQNRLHQMQSSAEAFEDGTPNFLSISAVPRGLDFLDHIGIEKIHDHVERSTRILLDGLRNLEHENGAPKVLIYGPLDMKDRGGAVAFNFIDQEGHVIPYKLGDKRASDINISLRGGCFCNPGAAEAALHIDADQSYECLESFSPGEFSLDRFAACLDSEAVGALRVSVGVASNDEDVSRFIRFAAEFDGSGK